MKTAKNVKCFFKSVVLLLVIPVLMLCISSCGEDLESDGIKAVEKADIMAEEKEISISTEAITQIEVAFATADSESNEYMIISVEETDNLHIDFPDKTPDGRDITELCEVNIKRFDFSGIPTMLLPEDWEEILGKFDENGTPEELRAAKKIEAFYTLCDAEQLTDGDSKEQLLEKYPIVEFTPVRILDMGIHDKEIKELLGYYLEYVGYTEQQCVADYYALVDKVKSADISQSEKYRLIGSITKPIISNIPKSSVNSVKLPKNLEVIRGAFSECSGLKSIKLPDSVEIIDNDAFRECSSLATIDIPESVKIIGSGAFSGCTGLTNIIIPNSVVSVYPNAFYGCDNLTIYAQAESQPDGWLTGLDYDWKSDNVQVVWGYNPE